MLIAKLSNPNKILYHEAKISKLDLANYFKRISHYILPHIKNRPLTFVRCPSPEKIKCFYQKHWSEGVPEGIDIVNIPEKNQKVSKYMMINHASGLTAAAQLAILEIHPWASRYDKLDYPDRLILDLDPSPEIPWKTLIEAGFIVHDSLAALDFKSYVKLTGGKGLHIVIPITRKNTYPEVKGFSKLFSEKLAINFPHLFTIEISKKKRINKIFIDYLRNEYEATAIAPFSPRLNQEASIAVPISWEELIRMKSSKEYTILTIEKYFDNFPKDPWQDFFKIKQSITKRHVQAFKGVV